jgi:hypothetical protein
MVDKKLNVVKLHREMSRERVPVPPSRRIEDKRRKKLKYPPKDDE